MNTRFPILLSAALLGGCPEKEKQPSTAGAFEQRAIVRIDAPTMGATVQSPFEVQYTLGPDVADFELAVDGESVSISGEGEIEAEPGRQQITLEGWDADGNLLNSHWVDVNVVDLSEPWVTITTPSSGATVRNPVQFGVEASEHIDVYEFKSQLRFFELLVRTPRCHGHRALALCDNFLARRKAARTHAARFRLLLPWIDTRRTPADDASRLA